MAEKTINVALACKTWNQLSKIYARDLSRNAFFLKTKKPPPLGTSVLIQLVLPSGSKIEFKGIVDKTYTEDFSRGAGIDLALEPIPQSIIWLLESAMTSAGITVKPENIEDKNDSSKKKEDGEWIIPEDELIQALWQELGNLPNLPPHQILNIPSNATQSELEESFTLLSKKYHPSEFDRYDSFEIKELAGEVFKLMESAYRKVKKTALPNVSKVETNEKAEDTVKEEIDNSKDTVKEEIDNSKDTVEEKAKEIDGEEDKAKKERELRMASLMAGQNRAASLLERSKQFSEEMEVQSNSDTPDKKAKETESPLAPTNNQVTKKAMELQPAPSNTPEKKQAEDMGVQPARSERPEEKEEVSEEEMGVQPARSNSREVAQEEDMGVQPVHSQKLKKQVEEMGVQPVHSQKLKKQVEEMGVQPARSNTKEVAQEEDMGVQPVHSQKLKRQVEEMGVQPARSNKKEEEEEEEAMGVRPVRSQKLKALPKESSEENSEESSEEIIPLPPVSRKRETLVPIPSQSANEQNDTDNQSEPDTDFIQEATKDVISPSFALGLRLLADGQTRHALQLLHTEAHKSPDNFMAKAAVEVAEGQLALKVGQRMEAAQRFELALRFVPTFDLALQEIEKMRNLSLSQRREMLESYKINRPDKF